MIFVLLPDARATALVDQFPSALSNYTYGGWQGPFGFGGAGNLSPNPGSSGIYMKGTYNGYVWALRSSPEFTGIDVTIRFTLPTRDNTDADAFAVDVLYHAPVTPSGGLCTSSGPTMCTYLTTQTGLKIYYRIGNDQLYITHFTGGVESILNQVSVPSVAVGVPHEARAVYSAGQLTFFLDSVKLVSMETPTVPAGQLGFEAYRVDMIVNTVTLLGNPTHQLRISASGSFDYLLQENIPIRIAASVTDAATGEPVSSASVNVTITDGTGSSVIPPTAMVEIAPGTGIYAWTSSLTIQQLHLPKGVYLAIITARAGGPSAEIPLLLHVDPPAANSSSGPSIPTLSILAIVAGALAGAIVAAFRKPWFASRAHGSQQH